MKIIKSIKKDGKYWFAATVIGAQVAWVVVGAGVYIHEIIKD